MRLPFMGLEFVMAGALLAMIAIFRFNHLKEEHELIKPLNGNAADDQYSYEFGLSQPQGAAVPTNRVFGADGYDADGFDSAGFNRSGLRRDGSSRIVDL